MSLADLDAEFPGWHAYAPGINGLLCARLTTSPTPVIVKGEDLLDLRDSIIRWEGNHSG
jgi:hypothetical protein